MTQELIITDIEVGSGKTAVKGALITTRYSGRLTDDTPFDASDAFQCVIGTGRVIKGWDQGIIGMNVGGKRQLSVPAHLAYGERQMGDRISANSAFF
jgi:peptidylprolyl isomerase